MWITSPQNKATTRILVMKNFPILMFMIFWHSDYFGFTFSRARSLSFRKRRSWCLTLLCLFCSGWAIRNLDLASCLPVSSSYRCREVRTPRRLFLVMHFTRFGVGMICGSNCTQTLVSASCRRCKDFAGQGGQDLPVAITRLDDTYVRKRFGIVLRQSPLALINCVHGCVFCI